MGHITCRQVFVGIIILIFCGLPQWVNSQENVEKKGVSVSAFGGYVWSHTGQTTNLKAHIFGFRAGYKHKTANNKQWQRLLNGPSWGVNYLYINYGKPNILGSVHAITPFVDFPLYKRKKFDINLRTTAGIGYITKKFDVQTNVVNRTIGSHLNANMGLFITGSYYINKLTEFDVVWGMTHFSNGNYNKPNLGVNAPNIGFGLTRFFNVKEVTQPKPDDLDTTKNEYRFSLGFGKKNADYIYPRVIIPFVLQFKYMRAISLKNKLGGGIDIFYDPDNFYTNYKNGNIKSASLGDLTELGIKIGHELQGKKLALITDVGYYLHNTNHLKGKLYQKIGFAYLINTTFSVYSNLKVHLKSADYFEFGINYSIRN